MTSESAEEIYKSLYEIFANRKSDQILEIEILTPDLGPLLQDGLCIGITKAALVKSFLVARQKLMKYLVHRSENVGYGTASLKQSEGVKELAVATQIILLFDCEHVTACNWRKRFISSSVQDHSINKDMSGLEEMLQRERSLLASFLCSPLHRHTKSPTLWQHRLWILTKLLDLQEQAAVKSEIWNEFLRKLILQELDVVCKSGQLHPRNYYAFSYMRQLHALVCQYDSPKEETLLKEASENTSQALLLTLALVMVEPMLKWWSSFALKDKMAKERKWALKRTIHFAVHIAAWESESLWTFVDLMVARFGVDILPAVDTDVSAIGDNGISAGARWQKTKLNVYKIYETRNLS
ncbi:conserved hypothetical protein [Talaromyces stipitatus ATCC 10500]|uniref:Uncharacterized protein n=1 Tax=Talaromyces stipitatus (strain ATCC 10500 / CBS 375.48 / QM 6759 / NRRL 1006) TaxID=441959 RepID=B8LUE4_TALSN|nr:uncharacterized protein TSTA_071200 [Talaromyces stipitatus ATCC 10500]EED23717.1 conserved hypothetical protein [Talaromyces stipitatus ATCC 10500]